MSSDRDEFGAFLVGFIVGGLTGAVVSLLFAPQSGEETRALIRDKSIEIRDKADRICGGSFGPRRSRCCRGPRPRRRTGKGRSNSRRGIGKGSS